MAAARRFTTFPTAERRRLCRAVGTRSRGDARCGFANLEVPDAMPDETARRKLARRIAAKISGLINAPTVR